MQGHSEKLLGFARAVVSQNPLSIHFCKCQTSHRPIPPREITSQKFLGSPHPRRYSFPRHRNCIIKMSLGDYLPACDAMDCWSSANPDRAFGEEEVNLVANCCDPNDLMGWKALDLHDSTPPVEFSMCDTCWNNCDLWSCGECSVCGRTMVDKGICLDKSKFCALCWEIDALREFARNLTPPEDLFAMSGKTEDVAVWHHLARHSQKTNSKERVFLLKYLDQHNQTLEQAKAEEHEAERQKGATLKRCFGNCISDQEATELAKKMKFPLTAADTATTVLTTLLSCTM